MTKHSHQIVAIIMAGGGGTRLWPVSRKKTPKQILPFIGTKTLLQVTVDRIKKILPISRIYIATNIAHKQVIQKQLPGFPKSQMIFEPQKKDTAAAIGFAAVIIQKKFPNAVVTTVNSDGYIQHEAEYRRVFKLAGALAGEHKDQTVLIGVRPTYPETGYGYIKIGKAIGKSTSQIYRVQRFIEKPDYATASGFVKRWGYFWNPAMFFWHIDTLLSLYRKFLPKHYSILMSIASAPEKQFERTIQRQFPRFIPISIDYGIMEKTKQMLVVPGTFGWADIGHWRSVKDVLSKREVENIIRGAHVGIDTTGSLIYGYANRLIATIGISNLVVVDTPDVLLVCTKERSQQVKKIVDALKKKGMDMYV